MFLESLDLISPKLTLYYKKKSSHSSFIGGILTILAYTTILAISIYFSLDIIQHNNPTAFYFNKFVEDAGYFPLNSSSMFHFFQMSLENNEVDVVDFDAITIIGIQELIGTYTENNDLSLYDHWIYGKCDKSKDINGLESIVETFTHFEESGCIRKFFNHTTQKYYNTDEDEFIYPSVDKGCSHPNRTFYGIIIERCRNTTLRTTPCKTDQEINQYISTHVGLEMELIDQFIDVTNYKTPYSKYFYKITNGLFDSTFSTNHLNFNPSSVKTHNGLMFDHIYDETSYIFDQNEKITQDTGNTGIYCAFYFWMQNRMQLYERSYKRLQDVIASAGGTTKLITVIASILNFLYNKFVTILDTESMVNDFVVITSNNTKTDNDKTTASQNCLNNNYVSTPSTTKKIPVGLKPINSNKKYILNTVPSKKLRIKLNFFEFLVDLIKIKNKNRNVYMYEHFRMKIVSEEQLVKNHIDIYNIMKLNEKEREKEKSVFDEYEAKDVLSNL